MWRMEFGVPMETGKSQLGVSIRHVSLSASTPAFENSIQLDKQVELAPLKTLIQRRTWNFLQEA